MDRRATPIPLLRVIHRANRFNRSSRIGLHRGNLSVGLAMKTIPYERLAGIAVSADCRREIDGKISGKSNERELITARPCSRTVVTYRKASLSLSLSPASIDNLRTRTDTGRVRFNSLEREKRVDCRCIKRSLRVIASFIISRFAEMFRALRYLSDYFPSLR